VKPSALAAASRFRSLLIKIIGPPNIASTLCAPANWIASSARNGCLSTRVRARPCTSLSRATTKYSRSTCHRNMLRKRAALLRVSVPSRTRRARSEDNSTVVTLLMITTLPDAGGVTVLTHAEPASSTYLLARALVSTKIALNKALGPRQSTPPMDARPQEVGQGVQFPRRLVGLSRWEPGYQC